MLLTETNQITPPLTSTKLTMLFQSVKLSKKTTLNRDLFEELLRKVSVSKDSFFTELVEDIDANWPHLAEGHRVLSQTWAARLDPGSGQKYYVNRATAQSTWDLPEELMSSFSQWEEMVDPSSGQTYYFNSATKETSWDKPGVEESVTHGTVTKSAWRECEDPGSGQVYFYNSDTHETTWDKPAEMDSTCVHQHAHKGAAQTFSDSDDEAAAEPAAAAAAAEPAAAAAAVAEPTIIELAQAEAAKQIKEHVLTGADAKNEGVDGIQSRLKGLGNNRKKQNLKDLKDMHKEESHDPKLRRGEMSQLRSSKRLSSWKGITLQLNKKNCKVLKMKDKKDGVGIDKIHEEFALIDVQDCAAFPGKQFHIVVLDGRRRKTLKFQVASDEEAVAWVDDVNFNVAWNLKHMAPK
jgi:hypothetical protein